MMEKRSPKRLLLVPTPSCTGSAKHIPVGDLELLEIGRAPSSQVQPHACVICGAKTSGVLAEVMDTRFGIPGSYGICRCSGCGLEQIDPVPEPAQLTKLYELYYNFGGEQGTRYTRLREWFLSSPAYRLWLGLDGDGSFHTRKGAAKLLDVGCNEGRGLRIYSRNGFQAEGLEPNEKAAGIARGAGFAVHTTTLENFHPAVPSDVVVLSNVLEHSLDPKRMLRDVARILQPGGQVCISCPNARSWLRTAFGRYWINWHMPFHIVHFSPATLEQLLLETGFTEVAIGQITPALWVASSLIARIFARAGRPTKQLRNPFLVLASMLLARMAGFPLLVLGNRLGRGDCLVAVATVAASTPAP